MRGIRDGGMCEEDETRKHVESAHPDQWMLEGEGEGCHSTPPRQKANVGRTETKAFVGNTFVWHEQLV